MSSWRSGPLVAAICLTLAACGQAGGGQAGGGAKPSSSPSVSASRAASAVDFRATCPRVAKVLVTLGAAPKAPVLESARSQVALLSSEGDVETKKVLAGMVKALADYRDAKPGQGTLDAKSALAGSVSSFAGLCQAAGAFAAQ